MSPFFPRAAVVAAALLSFAAAAAPLTLETALTLAVQRSEAARAARAGVSSASQSARAAGQLPDPMLRVGVDNLPITGADRLSSTRDSMTMKRIGISQEWLSSEKRAARQAVADAMLSRESVAVDVAAADTRLQSALAYLDAFYAGEALQLATLMEHHAHEELEASRARLSSPTGSSQEVLALSVARGTTEDDVAQLRQQQATAQVILQRWIGKQADALAPVIELAVPTESAFVAGHPRVAVLQREVELAKQSAALASGERRPNWTWEVSYAQRSGYSDMLSVGVSIPLPIAREQRQDRDTASKLARVDQSEADLAEALRAATAEYQALASDAQRLQQRIDRYRSGAVVPAAQRSAAATAAYRSNQASLTTWFEARHAAVDAQRKLLSLQRDLTKAQAQLAFKPLAPGALP